MIRQTAINFEGDEEVGSTLEGSRLCVGIRWELCSHASVCFHRDSNTSEHNAQSALDLQRPRNHADSRALEHHRATADNRPPQTVRGHNAGKKSLFIRSVSSQSRVASATRNSPRRNAHQMNNLLNPEQSRAEFLSKMHIVPQCVARATAPVRPT